MGLSVPQLSFKRLLLSFQSLYTSQREQKAKGPIKESNQLYQILAWLPGSAAKTRLLPSAKCPRHHTWHGNLQPLCGGSGLGSATHIHMPSTVLLLWDSWATLFLWCLGLMPDSSDGPWRGCSPDKPIRICCTDCQIGTFTAGGIFPTEGKVMA